MTQMNFRLLVCMPSGSVAYKVDFASYDQAVQVERIINNCAPNYKTGIVELKSAKNVVDGLKGNSD